MPGPTITTLADAPEKTYPLHGDLRVRELLSGSVAGGTSLYRASVRPGEGVEVTTHDVDETVYIAAGSARLPDGTVLGEGTCVHLPAGTPHGLTNPGPATLELELLIHPKR